MQEAGEFLAKIVREAHGITNYSGYTDKAASKKKVLCNVIVVNSSISSGSRRLWWCMCVCECVEINKAASACVIRSQEMCSKMETRGLEGTLSPSFFAFLYISFFSSLFQRGHSLNMLLFILCCGLLPQWRPPQDVSNFEFVLLFVCCFCIITLHVCLWARTLL